ncbi:hypothetical protein ON010_g875 [Phytophthora cinnamomi]|nr:hypothetical protein ON010_g875 [Phytophthora cinnamomi]
MYATVSNQEQGRLYLTPAVIAEANFHKKAIYALMVENLQADCNLGIVDPFQELDRLNPECAHPKTKEAAIAMVCTYLLHERLRSVDTRVPCTNWVNPHVLQTYAQYLRQPLQVMDVDTHGDGHLQIYTYQDFVLETPGYSELLIHETGSYTALTDHEATKYLGVCRRLHVLPTFMLLRTHESHFYGVQHGELFYKWQAEGDPGFAAEVAHPYDWRDGFLSRPTDVVVTKIRDASRTQVGFEVQVGGIPLDLLDDTNDTNAHLHRSLTMR